MSNHSAGLRLGNFYTYRFFSACLPYLPVASACFVARGMSIGAVMGLGTIYCVGVALLGVPLASLADRHGYRKAMLAGTLALAAGCLAATLAHGIAGLVVAQLLFATSGALDAGTDSAYLFDQVSRHAAGEASYRICEARSATVKLAGNVLGFAIGGLLAGWSPSAPFAAGGVAALIAAACVARLDDVKTVAHAVAASPRALGFRQHLQTLRQLVTVAQSGRYVVLAALTASMARVALTTTGPFLASQHVSLAVVGLITATGAALAALITRRSVQLADRLGERTLLSLLPVALLATHLVQGLEPARTATGGDLGGMGLAGAAAVVLAVLPQVLVGVYTPLWRSYLNARIVDTSRRATLLAMDGTIARIAFAVFSSLLGLIGAGAGPRAALRGCAVLGAIGLVIVAALPASRRRKSPRRRLVGVRLGWAFAGACAMVLVASARGGIAQADSQAPLVVATRATVELPTLPASALVLAPARSARFSPAGDDAALARLCSLPITRLRVNHSGTTIKFKATLSDGTRASLRPAQQSEAGYFRADVAAYRLSRALGLGAVPPACIRTIDRAALQAAAVGTDVEARLDEEVRWDGDGATTQASLELWVDHVSSAHLDATQSAWRPLLRQTTALDRGAQARAAADGSQLLAWDFLIANWDRWSGDNTFRADDKPVWLDNAAGFGRYGGASRRRNEASLSGVERFSRSFVASLRTFSDEEIARDLRPAGLPPRALRQLAARRAALLDRVDALTARYGEDAVLSFE